MPYRSTSVAALCWRVLPRADHVARSVGASSAKGPRGDQQLPDEVLAALSSRGAHHVGVEQQIVAAQLSDVLPGADHHPRQCLFGVVLVFGHRVPVGGQRTQPFQVRPAVAVEEPAEGHPLLGIQQPTVGRPKCAYPQ